MESERRPADIGESAVVAGQAHRRIDMLLDKVSELTTERDQWMRSHTELGRQLNSAHEMNAELSQHYRELASERDAARAELTNATNRALDEVIAALAGWVEGVQSNCEATGHKDCDCANEFSVDDIRNMIEDARRQLGAERDFDTVIDSGPDSEPGGLVAEIDRLRAELARTRDSRERAMNRSDLRTAERDEAKSKLTEALTWLRSAEAERDEAQAKAERAEALMRAGWRANQSGAIRDIAGQRDAARAERDEAQTQCRLLNREIDDARASLDDVRRERDRANAMVANLHTVLKGIVKSIDSQEPK